MGKKVLITGGTGRIGTCVAEGLTREGYEVFLGSRSAHEGNNHIIQINYLDKESVLQATKGMDAIIHLGFDMGMREFMKGCHEMIITAFNLYDSARLNGVPRVIFGSSNHALGYWKKGESVTTQTNYRPDSPYGLVKCYVELMGQYYADRYGVSSLNVRIGHFGVKNETPDSDRATYIWLSNRDCQQLFLKCLEYTGEKTYLNVFGMSGNTGCPFDMSGNKEIGYEPEDDGADYRGMDFSADFNETAAFGLPVSIEELNQVPYVGGFFVGMTVEGSIDIDYILKEIGKK